MRRFFIAAATAAVLAALAASPVLAGNTDVTASDTVTVPSAVTITGVPASINYGTVAPGSVSPEKSYPITVSGNTGFTFRLLGTALTGSAGTLSCGFRMLAFDQGTLANMQYVDSTNPSLGCQSTSTVTGSAGTTSFTVRLAIAIPASTAPGTYSGTVTFRAETP
jgi:hypothetical protein